MQSGPIILCVDDQEDNLKIRTLLLQQFGCRTIAVPDHRSALRTVTEQEVDLLLIDYHLAAGETGEEVARDVRVLQPHVPLIMLTGDSSIPQTARESVDAVLVKGVSDPRTLMDTIERLLPGKKLKPRRSMLVWDGSDKVS